MELAESIAALEELVKGGLFAFASRPAQGQVGEVMMVLSTLARGYSLSFVAWGGDQTLKFVLDSKLPFFVKHVHVPEKLDDVEQQVLYGAPALKMLLEDAKNATAQGVTIHLETLKPLTFFDWLLTHEEKVQIQKRSE